MSMIKALRTLAAIENGTLNAAQLEAQITGSQARRDEISQLLAVRSLFDRIANSKNAMTALCGSAAAVNEIALHRFFGAFIGACTESVSAKMAIWNSDAMLLKIAASPSAMASMRAASRYSVVSATANSTASVSLAGELAGANYIVLGCSSALGGTTWVNTLAAKRSGSAISAAIAMNISSDALAKDTDAAVPITAPYSFTSGAGNVYLTYFGVLRCDI